MRIQGTRAFIILGIFSPLILFFFITVLTVFWPDYNFISETVSVLGSSASPFQTSVNVLGFGLFGIIMTGVALAVGEQLEKNHFSVTATRLFLASGLLIFILGFFPTDRSFNVNTFNGKLHSLIGVTAFIMMSISIIWHGLAFQSDEQWERLWVVISYILGLVSFFTGVIIKIYPKFYYNGIIERFGLGAVLLWIFLVSLNCFFMDKLKRSKF